MSLWWGRELILSIIRSLWPGFELPSRGSLAWSCCQSCRGIHRVSDLLPSFSNDYMSWSTSVRVVASSYRAGTEVKPQRQLTQFFGCWPRLVCQPGLKISVNFTTVSQQKQICIWWSFQKWHHVTSYHQHLLSSFLHKDLKQLEKTVQHINHLSPFTPCYYFSKGFKKTRY